MTYETSKERRIRRRVNDYYGSHEVDTVEEVDENEYMVRLFDGTIAIASILEDGSIDIQENAPWQ